MSDWPYDVGLTPERIWLEKRCLDLGFAITRTLDGLKHRPDYHRLHSLTEELLRRVKELADQQE